MHNLFYLQSHTCVEISTTERLQDVVHGSHVEDETQLSYTHGHQTQHEERTENAFHKRLSCKNKSEFTIISSNLYSLMVWIPSPPVASGTSLVIVTYTPPWAHSAVPGPWWTGRVCLLLWPGAPSVSECCPRSGACRLSSPACKTAFL